MTQKPRGRVRTEVERRWLVVLVAAAFAVRAGARLAGGEESFLTNGYTLHLTLADNLLAGNGLCYGPGESCAVRLPLYSLLVAGFQWLGWLYPGLVLAQAAMGGGMVWLAWWLGRALFSPAAGLVAAAATAFNPYAVIHDTALQDTALLNVLMLGALALLVAAQRANQARFWLAAGTALGLAALTSGRVVLFIPVALVWPMIGGAGAWRGRARSSLILVLPIVVLVGAWVVRNWRVTGMPVLTTVSDESLFLANSPLTFMHFPGDSIDLTTGELWRLPAADLERIERVLNDPPARNRLMRQLTYEFVATHPAEAIAGAVRKLWVVASAQLSPSHDALNAWGYRLMFVPVHVLALAGAWRVRQRWREHVWPGLFVAVFLVTTAVYWAHTSHKSLIDPVLFVYAAAAWFAFVPARPPR